VDPRAGLDDVKKRKFLTLPGRYATTPSRFLWKSKQTIWLCRCRHCYKNNAILSFKLLIFSNLMKIRSQWPDFVGAVTKIQIV
jgi:hypothetical protein